MLNGLANNWLLEMNKPSENGVYTNRDDLDGVLAWGMPGERCMSQAVGE